MPKDVFYFDPPGPRSYKTPWLTFSDDPLRPEPRRGKPTQIVRRESTLKSPGSVERAQNRQRPKYRPKPQVISLLSSDDERGSDPLKAQESQGKRHQKKVYQKRVSIEDINKGMAAAKRLSRAAAISSPQKEVKRPALAEITMEQPPGIRRFGTYTNSVEFKDRKLLVKMGFISPKRPRLSDPSTLENLAHDTAEWTVPFPAFPKPSIPSSTPPSSFIPLDLD